MTAVSPVLASISRIMALVLRHFYVLRKSVIRLGEVIYWPTMQMIMWGYLGKYLASQSAAAGGPSALALAPGLLIAGVLLWDVLFRSQIGVALTFLEELYSRNLGHLFVSPLRPWELIGATLVMGTIRTTIGVGVAALLAIAIHDYSVFGLGAPLAAFFANLMIFGWAFGLVACALVLRFGLAAENFAWGFVFAIAPVSGIYYPVAILPAWLQPVALALPSTHVFEGMRAWSMTGVFRWDYFAAASGLNVIYLAIAALSFAWAFRSARELGLLLQTGE